MNFKSQQNSQDAAIGKNKSSIAGKIGITLFFLFFFGMGMLFEVFLIREVARSVISRTWPKVICTILESSVRDDSNSSNPYCFAVKYQYIYQNITWQSEQYQFKNNGFSDYQQAQKLVETYPAESETVCFVNPKNPAEAILRHSSLALAFFIIIPTIFVLIGGGGIYGTWFYKQKTAPDDTPVRKPKGNVKKNGWGLILFGFIFAAAGAGISYPLLIRPLWNSLSARNWVETPCKIISTRILSHDSDDGTTYSVDILYEYIVDDIPHRNNRYDFISGSSSGYDGKQEVVNRYRSMKDPVCYVNPDNPSDAVLVRNITWKNALGLLPLLFIAAGLAVMAGGISKYVKSSTLRPDRQWLPRAISKSHGISDFQRGYDRDFGDKIVLKPQLPTLYKLFGILFFCLFWNGFISFFVFQMISGFRSGRPEWCLALFLIPFEIVGIGTIVAVVYQFLALFNPRFNLTIQPGNLYPGSEGQIFWTVRGWAGRIRRLSIKLTGREEATYRRGTDICTDKKTFFEKELVSTEQLQEISDGQVRFSIPQNTMHSFESDNNKIVWLIELRGDIARWPDVSQEYKIMILPKAIM